MAKKVKLEELANLGLKPNGLSQNGDGMHERMSMCVLSELCRGFMCTGTTCYTYVG